MLDIPRFYGPKVVAQKNFRRESFYCLRMLIKL